MEFQPRPLILWFGAGVLAFAQQYVVPPAGPYVRVHGEATVSAAPDRAEMDIGVISHGDTAKMATDLNASKSNAVIEQLHAILPSANIKTVNFSVNPNYDYSKNDGKPIILGYTANNTVRLEIDDISTVRKLIDAATRAGADNINRLNFKLRDENAARAAALGQAAAQARAGADALAASLKLKLGRVLRVEEEQPVVVSPGRQFELSLTKSREVTPLEPGNIDIRASINVTFELIQ